MNIENQILANELGKLGGFGARWVSKILPMRDDRKQFSFNMDYLTLSKVVTQSFIDLGGDISEALSNSTRVSAIMGAGTLGLNPTIIHAYIKEKASGSELDIHALSKEGLINQSTSKKALLSFIKHLDEKIT